MSARAQSYHYYDHYDDAAAPASSSPDSSSGGSFDSGVDHAWARDIVTMKAMMAQAQADARRFEAAPAAAQLERAAGAGLPRVGPGGVIQPRGEPEKVRACFAAGAARRLAAGCSLSRFWLRPPFGRCAALVLASPRRCAR